MVAAPFHTPQAAPLGRAQVEDEAERLARALMAAVMPPGGPRRLALMNGPARERKYSDAPKGHRFALEDMRDHLAGRRTWAAALLDRDGLALAGCRDYDGDDGSGEALGLAALVTLAAAGVTAAAILLDGRAHVWALYRRPAPAGDIRAQLAAHTPQGPGDLFPSGNNIRLPLGAHRRKGNRRGVLALADGRRFDLDTPGGLAAGLRALLALPRNAPPPAAPPEARQRSAGATTLADPTLWEGVTAEQGAALMASPRYRALFTNRPQLARLARGERVVITTDAGPDDTGNQQVAALVANLLSTGRSAEGLGPIVPGLGAPPLAEVRAVALHWHTTLRPDCDIGRYQADVDRLIAKYTPPGYQPEATRGIAQQPAPAPQALGEARHRGRPAGDLNRALDRLAAELAAGATITRAGLALALGCTPRTVTSHLAALRAAGRVELQATARGYRVLRVENKSTPAPEAASAQQGAANPAEGGTKFAPVEGGKLSPFAALERGATTEEHTAPPGPPCPAPAAAAGDAAADPPAWGSDADRLALAGELVALGFPGRAWFVACELADPARRASFLAELRPLVEAEAGALEARALERFAAELVAQALGRAGVSAAPQAPAAAPAPAYSLAELDAAEGKILEAVAAIHAERVDRLDRETGEVVARKAPATRARVAELLADMPPALFDAAWARYRDPWGRERRRLWRLDPAGLAAAATTAARKHAQAVKRESPRAAYLGALAALAAEVCARRGVDPTQPARRKARADKVEARKAAQGRAERLPALLRLLEAERAESVSQAPQLPAWASPPPDDVPHPAEALGPAPAAAPPAPSAAAGLADRLRVVAARPRVQVAALGPRVEPVAARAGGYSADECEAWLLANGWRKGPGGEWVQPPAKLATAAD